MFFKTAEFLSQNLLKFPRFFFSFSEFSQLCNIYFIILLTLFFMCLIFLELCFRVGQGLKKSLYTQFEVFLILSTRLSFLNSINSVFAGCQKMISIALNLFIQHDSIHRYAVSSSGQFAVVQVYWYNSRSSSNRTKWI